MIQLHYLNDKILALNSLWFDTRQNTLNLTHFHTSSRYHSWFSKTFWLLSSQRDQHSAETITSIKLYNFAFIWYRRNNSYIVEALKASLENNSLLTESWVTKLRFVEVLYFICACIWNCWNKSTAGCPYNSAERMQQGMRWCSLRPQEVDARKDCLR